MVTEEKPFFNFLSSIGRSNVESNPNAHYDSQQEYVLKLRRSFIKIRLVDFAFWPHQPRSRTSLHSCKRSFVWKHEYEAKEI